MLVLKPFFEGTVLLSDRQYATLSYAKIVKFTLESYLNSDENVSDDFANDLKLNLFSKFEYYCEKITTAQHESTMVSNFDF